MSLSRDDLVKQVTIKREIEYRKCEKSFSYFFFTYWYVLSREGRALSGRWSAQVEVAEMLQSTTRLVFLKARQIGFSTLISAYCFWLAWFNKDKRIRVISHRREDARDLIGMMKLGYKMLPDWLRERGSELDGDRAGDIAFLNGSIIMSDSPSSGGGQGKTLDLLVLDEFGKMQDPSGLWGSALPAAENGQIIVLGNPNGEGTRWWQICQQAKEKLSEFVYGFYSWNAAPYRDADWLSRHTSSMTPSEIAMTYPSDDVMAWVAAGDPVFDTELLMSFDDDVEPGEVMEGEHGATVTVWEPSVMGQSYAAGVDIAYGAKGGDYSSIDIVHVETGEHVYSWHGHCEPSSLAVVATAVCREYNSALLAWEANGAGGKAFTNSLQETKYRNLYRRRFLDGGRGYQSKNGWITTDATKGVLINSLQAALFSDDSTQVLKTRSQRHLMELRAYRHLANGRMGGLPHDDRVISLGIALQAAKQHRCWALRTVIARPVKIETTTTPVDKRLALEPFMQGKTTEKQATKAFKAYHEDASVRLTWGRSSRRKLMAELKR